MNKERIYWLDIIRTVAILAVILNHSFGYFSFDNFQLYADKPIYYLDCILNSLTRFNVPFFFMLSGGLILSNEKCTNICYIKNKIIRIFFILLVWTIIYSFTHLLINSGTIKGFIKDIIFSIFKAKSYAGHLWFLYTLIILYALTPLLKYSITNNSKYTFFLIVGLNLIFDFFYPVVKEFIKLPDFANSFSPSFISGNLLYYILGYYLINKYFKISNGILFFISIIFGLLIGLLTIFVSLNQNKNFYSFQNFNSPLVLIYSISLFLLIKNIYISFFNKQKKIIIIIADYSFGIYLVHFFFRDLYMNLIKYNFINEYLYLILSPIMVFISSFLFVMLLEKNHIVRYILFGKK